MTLPQVIPNSPQWKDCLRYIAQRVNEQSFNTWFKPTRGGINGDGQFYLAVPNQFVADWIKGHFGEVIDEAFREVLGSSYQLEFVIAQIPEVPEQNALNLELPLPERPEPLPVPQTQPLGRRHDHNLNRKYTFDSLVVGDFNQFAFAAAQAVAEAPGLNKYNPLFIYGGTGLGKTHIVQAIGNAILEAFPNKRIFYATSEKFTSDFIASISDRTIADFTKVYRDVDVLIIDDIQFFSGKESTQEQFFHTFNSLHHLGKMIVLTADRPPREIKGLEERLLSRFQWGLVADLQAPDLENRTAILYKKLETEGITLPDNIVRYIADQVQTNIRELEGALIRLLAYASLRQEEVDLKLAEKVLGGGNSVKCKVIEIEAIQRKAAEYFKVEPHMMQAKKKTADVVLARQVAMYLCRSLTSNSLKVIGAAFGGRDHSTVIHACDLISRRMAREPDLRHKIDQISASLLY
ncbi:MAG TPA: chromosomal replication initiator protein DnaA [candidate division Zixibacteria bacterium]|nr:chromosomal replication initiator protein DnaA [candidate division Zixibacteria bacterium]MDM7971534.1 chromosomal replication initiator protein DnaA [candidate division Zixibacteria bacterium]HPM36752.1 chromosomal replication initiator protein DnaA [candidate division Zixibacteria bacterium]HQL23808.1 chromosomal replication initiator protein DnaA [candidate division Zixibacteria bacterium]